MKPNALILTRKDLCKGANPEEPKIGGFPLEAIDLAQLDFIAYINDGEIRVFKSRYWQPGLHQMTFEEMCKQEALQNG